METKNNSSFAAYTTSHKRIGTEYKTQDLINLETESQ